MEKNIKFLWNCATALKPATHTHKLLKSYYMGLCRQLASESVEMPKSKFAATQMCSHCSVFWVENEFTMKIRSQSAVYNAKARKLIAKLEEAQSQNKPELLSRKQKQRAKWLKKRITNYVELHCNLCKHKTMIRMQKPHHKKKPQQMEDKIKTESSDIPKITKKKKKTSKGKNSGLQTIINKCNGSDTASTIPTLQSACVKQSNQMINGNKNINTRLTPPVKQVRVEKTTSGLSMKATANAAKKPKTKLTMSKTQSDNSLLRLAALLKSQRTSSIDGNCSENSNTTQQRLAALLK